LSTGTNTFVPGTTTIRYAGTTNKIYNVWNVEATAGANPVVIAGAVTAGPKLIGATFVNADKSTGTAVTEGDKIILTFSAPVAIAGGNGFTNNSFQIINDGVAVAVEEGDGSAAQDWQAIQPFADKSKVVLTAMNADMSNYYISTGTTLIRKTLGTATGIKDAYGNAVADAAAVAIQAEPVASSAKQPTFGATYIDAAAGIAENYISDTNKAAATVKFDLPTAGVAGDRIYWKLADGSVPVKSNTGTTGAAITTAQTININATTNGLAEGNLTLTAWVVEKDGKISQEVSQVIKYDATVPTALANAVNAASFKVVDATTITVVFSEKLDATKFVANNANGFAVAEGIATLTKAELGADGVTVTLTGTNFAAGTTTVAYTAGTLTDLAGNALAGILATATN
jgi:hypothetical protein